MISKLLQVAIICFMVIAMPILSFVGGYTLQQIIQKKKHATRLQLSSNSMFVLFVLEFCFICVSRTNNVWLWMLTLNFPFGVLGWSRKHSIIPTKVQLKLHYEQIVGIVALVSVVAMFLLCLKPIYGINWIDGEVFGSNKINIIWIFVLAWIIDYLVISFWYNGKTNAIILIGSLCVWLLVFIMELVWRITYESQVARGILTIFADQVILLNVGILLIVSTIFFVALGKSWGVVLNAVLYLFLFLSNMIKIRYHDTFFTWFDLLQLKEAILIGREFLTAPIIVLVVLITGLLFFLIVKFRKKLKAYLKPQIRVVPTLALIVLLASICTSISNDQYRYLDIYKRTWENEAVNVRLNGLIVNLLMNYNALQEIVMVEPEGYSKESANDLLEKFEQFNVKKSDAEENPNVILIMAESLFDLDGVEGLQFDMDIDATIDEYSISKMLSPRYGGYTSAMEFEALTGLSLAFMPPSLTPFTTYFNNPEDDFPSIVHELKKNGYFSVAIHPDLADFYNRTIVYKNMGFDEYQAINDFVKTEANTTLNGWITDEELGNRIVEELEKSEDPKFIYAVTMEEHYVNVDKYSEPEVNVTSDLLGEEDLATISQQATSYYHTDKMIQSIIEYIDSVDKPTLLYVFGDHLPPLEALGKLGYTDKLENKYNTSLVMYSNYKDINVDAKYITPNQLASQIMVDSEIVHSSYFDYIYYLREAYPVVHQEFTDIMNNMDLDTYRFIQYDMLFGERYLVE